MQKNLELFKHTYIDNASEKTLVLLHGTGGDEYNLLFFDDILQKKYNLLGLRGNVDEDGMTRFFRRFEMGVFDQENIREETSKLHDFLNAWTFQYKISIDKLSYLGYSNGANMILATLFYFPNLIYRAALLHGMLPFTPKKKIDLSTHSLFVSYGLYDQMIPASDSKKMIQTLESFHADVSIHEYQSGHDVTQQEVRDIATYLLEK